MIGAPGRHIDLARAILVDDVAADPVFGRNRAGVADGQGRIDHRPLQRPPDIDEGVALAEQALGLLAHQLAHPLRSRAFGIVVVHPHHRLARHAGGAVGDVGVAPAQGVVEHLDPAGAGDPRDQLGRLAVGHRVELGLVIEVLHPRGAAQEGDAFPVQIEIGRTGTGVVDGRPMLLVDRVGGQLAGLVGAVGDGVGLLRHWLQVEQPGLDVVRRMRVKARFLHAHGASSVAGPVCP